MVKGDADKYRKSLRGKMPFRMVNHKGKMVKEYYMDKKQKAQYHTLLARESKGYAEAKAKLEARKARGDFKPKKDPRFNYPSLSEKQLELKGKEVKRPKYKKETRSVVLPENKLQPKYVDKSASRVDAEESYIRALDPTNINVKRDAKKFGKFNPRFIRRTEDSGLTDRERSVDEGDTGYFGQNFVQYPTTTTGDEYIFKDIDGSGVLRHPAMRNDKPVFGRSEGVATKLHYAPFDKPKEGREYSGIRDYALNENTIIGQTIDRGDTPQSKPKSWEGTKGGGYSRKEAYKASKPMTLERRLTKKKVGTIGKTDEELRQSQAHPQQKPFEEPKAREYPNIPILKSVNYIAGKMKYGDFTEREKEVAKIRIANRGNRGCEENNTCSEFYILNDRPTYKEPEMTLGKLGNRIQVEGGIGTYQSAPAYDSDDDTPRSAPNYTSDINEAIDPLTMANYQGRRGKTPLENFYNPHEVKYEKGEHMPRTDVKQPLKGVSKPSEIDYELDRLGESLRPSKTALTEIGITKSYGGVVSGVNELEVKEGMSYSFDKTRPRHRKERQEGMKPVSKLSDKDRIRLMKTKGIPTTTREKKSKDYEPAPLSRLQQLRKLKGGLPVDMSYNYYGTAPTSDSAEESRQALMGNPDVNVSDGEDDFDEEDVDFNPMGDMATYRDAFRTRGH